MAESPICCAGPESLLRQILLRLLESPIGGGGNPIEVDDEGVPLTLALASLNFVGAGVTATAVGADVTITIPGAAATAPGGANTQVQYNNAGVFGGIVNATTDGTTLTATSMIINGALNAKIFSSTGHSLTGVNATTAIDIAATWNTTGTPSFFKIALTNTASNVNSKVIEVLGGVAGATNLFTLFIDGQSVFGSSMTVGGNLFVSASGSFGGFLAMGGGQPLSWGTSVILQNTAAGTLTLADYAGTSSGNLILGNLGATVGTSGEGVLVLVTDTAPTTSPADSLQLWSADAGAGNANLFARNEAGEVEQLTGLSSRVSTQFDKTSDTTLANITGLTFNVEAGKTYSFETELFTTSNVAGGVKAAIAGTATATAIIYEALVFNAVVVAAQTRSAALGTAVGGITTVTAAKITITGTITVNAAGTLTVQFAQNASNAAASSVLVGSYFKLTPNP